ncbi:MAG: DUF2490 domain-containing protein [Gemmatimonadetes bacterium]|nr:DUF2490 domain-containing protein [Gemmatimonadota bacterium]
MRRLLLGALVATSSGAQTSRSDPTDLQAWYGGSLRLDLPSRWRASAEYRLRMVDNAHQVRGSYVTLGASRRVAGPLRFLSSYRLALVNEGTFHRVAGGAEAEREVGDVTLGLRGLVQYQKQNFTDNDETSSDEDTFVRARLELSHRLSDRVDLYASSEPYLALGANHVVDNWRNTVGTKLELAKGRKLNLFYIYRPDYAKATYNRTFHVIGVDLDWTVKVGGGKAATPR